MKYVTLKKWFGKFVIIALVLCVVISMTVCGKKADDDSGKETTGATETVGETVGPQLRAQSLLWSRKLLPPRCLRLLPPKRKRFM